MGHPTVSVEYVELVKHTTPYILMIIQTISYIITIHKLALLFQENSLEPCF